MQGIDAGLTALKFKSDYQQILEHAQVRQPLQVLKSKSHYNNSE